MPTATYIPLATITLSNSSQATVTFANIPNTYKDLVMVYNGETVSSGAFDLLVLCNGATGVTSTVTMYGSGSSTSSFTQTDNLANYGSGSRTVMTAQIFDYATTDKHKSGLVRANSTNGVGAHAIRYASTTAVTSLAIRIGSGTFASGSTFSLYGIAG